MSASTKLASNERLQLRKAEQAVDFARIGVEDAEDNLRIKRQELTDAEKALSGLQGA